MASAAIFDAIRTFLDGTGGNGSWTTTPIRWENEAFTLPDHTPFVSVEMTGTLYGQESFGASTQALNRWDEEGVLWLHVLVPDGSGGHTVRLYAKQLADLFRGKTLLSGSLEFRDAFIGRGVAGVETGNWYRLSTYINWRRIDA
jgi:hypothetical protein